MAKSATFFGSNPSPFRHESDRREVFQSRVSDRALIFQQSMDEWYVALFLFGSEDSGFNNSF
jgi:hypothetical protein